MQMTSITVNGFETQFGVNHLGHFFLTFLLLDLLKHSAPSRVINISSLADMMGNICFEDLNLERNYHPIRAYAQSKLANVLFTRELAKRTKALGVTVYVVDSGVVNTGLVRHLQRPLQLLISWFSYLVKTPGEGAQTSIYLSVTPESELWTGGYDRNCVDTGLDDGATLKFWTMSCHLLGIRWQ